MTTAAFRSVGFCAHYSEQGDWAFRFALGLARQHRLQLNIFHFLRDPYGADPGRADPLSPSEKAQRILEREKELRFYYDERLGDYLEAGFRLCEDNGWTELHRCMCKREFQLLVLPFPRPGATFAGRPVTRFAAAFACPVVLVGPTRADEFRLNSPAALLAHRLPLRGLRWTPVEGEGKIRVVRPRGLARAGHTDYTAP